MTVSVPGGDFNVPLDIANRACQHMGVRRITSFAQDDVAASEISFNYDKLRRSELRRAVWEFSTRKTVLRPVDVTSFTVIPAAYNPAKIYIQGALVSFGGEYYEARGNVGLALPPDANPDLWLSYFGSDHAKPWDSTTTYYAGEVVYWPASAPTSVYKSITSANADTPGTVPAWDATVIYRVGDTVTFSAATWQSSADLNLNNTPGVTGWISVPATQPVQMTGQNWLKLDSTLASIRVIYPLGAGPQSQAATRNVFQLPHGWLREAMQDPKAGNFSFLGFPSNGVATDWTYEGNFLVSRWSTPIIYRFAADVVNVMEMDPMFCERLASRIALETCERITQSTEKLQTIGSAYKRFGDDAINVNAIVKGSEEAALDDWIACRI